MCVFFHLDKLGAILCDAGCVFFSIWTSWVQSCVTHTLIHNSCLTVKVTHPKFDVGNPTHHLTCSKHHSVTDNKHAGCLSVTQEACLCPFGEVGCGPM
uniref:Uncharacterized protein n=1 Tax=Daphnia magna TaxID=35525 RepID=A0A0P5K245_9CRUS